MFNNVISLALDCTRLYWFKHILFHFTWKGMGQSRDAMLSGYVAALSQRLYCTRMPHQKGTFTFTFTYPIVLDRRGTTGVFSTDSLYSLRLYAFLKVSLSSNPAHSLILSSHLFFCLPLFLLPYLLIGDVVPVCDAKEFPKAPYLHGLYPSSQFCC